MGTYLNPGNSEFAKIRNSDYVDKTGMIKLLNRNMGTTRNLTCISRPRRFGKSYAVQMICAYYDSTCNSHMLFDDLSISKDSSYEDHLNKYHVINLDISGFVSDCKKDNLLLEDVPKKIEQAIVDEIKSLYPELENVGKPSECILELVRRTGKKIVFVIDEWDSMIREVGENVKAQDSYLNLLRGWFKNNNFTPEAVAAAYMTGILPIKKDGTQSAISNFQEYTMLEPLDFAEYVGFSEGEVKKLCQEKNKNFDNMKKWYDGYTVGDNHSVYNPYSVLQACSTGKYKSYWKKTTAAETLMTYIDMDMDGLQDDVARLIAGESIEVDTDFFQNDVEHFESKDDVLTLLIHLGYLTYEEVSDSYDDKDEQLIGLCRIPNEEVRTEFEKILRKATHKDLVKLIRKSDKLIEDTLSGDEVAVAKAIQEIHDSAYAPTFYNDEQSLRYVIRMAYISSVDQYAKIEELPSGHGIADVVFIPKRRSAYPAMIIELKWNKSDESAIKQILDNGYPKVLEDYGGEILLVGINYDAHTKEHTCSIRRKQ